MAQASSKLFDNVGRMMNDAAGVAEGVRREIESMVRAQAERFIMDMNLVKREDYDALRELVQRQSTELSALKVEVATLKSGKDSPAAVKVAVISDVHGNRLALEAVLDDITRQKVDATFNLGDLVSGPLEPNWTADILMELDIPTVRGNHERNIIDNPPDRLDRVDRFAQEQMDSRHRAWINALPETLAMLEDVFLCHGTPTSCDDPWLDNWWDGRTVIVPDEAQVAAKAEGFDFPLMLCGHTHVPRAVRLKGGRLIVNPGSVGLQFHHGSPDARYATIEVRGGKYYPSFHAVPYDHAAAARLAEANGFPRWREVLMTGWGGAQGLF